MDKSAMSQHTPQGYVPLGRACVCLDCEAVFLVGPTCPACASEHFVPLATWMASTLTPLDPRTVDLDTMLDYVSAYEAHQKRSDA